MATTEHQCICRNCDQTISARLIFCPKHWEALPKGMREKLIENFRIGQFIGIAGNQPTGWQNALHEAVFYLEP